jgi:type II secretory pathway pseudopilin PulG
MFKFNYKKGFTLLEALVATSILMVAVAAPITIAQKGLSFAVYSKNQMIASYLAQDAIEYIKNKRDEISIGNKDNYLGWDSLKIFDLNDGSCLADSSCDIDTISGAIRSFSGTVPLEKDNNGFYVHSGVTKTIFTRKINIKISDDNDGEALITVTVNWGGAENEVVVKTLIYNI